MVGVNSNINFTLGTAVETDHDGFKGIRGMALGGAFVKNEGL
jgi:hypothetical protein